LHRAWREEFSFHREQKHEKHGKWLSGKGGGDRNVKECEEKGKKAGRMKKGNGR
jgi:hypothetical protein